jgi:hypothetical protein
MRKMGFLALCLFGLSASAPAQQALVDPLRFFEGRTESKGSIKIVFKKATKTYSAGRGRIESDGSLSLVQQVSDDGKEPHERRWRIRQVSSGRFVGTMTDAVGPVKIEEVGGRYRFRFQAKGSLTIEQWLAPLPDGRSARSTTTVRKLGMKVATGDAIIRKIPS